MENALNRVFRKLLRCRDGNFGVMSAFVIVPVIGALGVAVDLSVLALQSSNLQDAVDSSALMVAHSKETISDGEAEQIVRNMLKANLGDVGLSVSVSRAFPQVTVTAQMQMPTTFMHVFGQETMTATRKAVVDVAEARYEIALVLDTTASMAGGKLAARRPPPRR